MLRDKNCRDYDEKLNKDKRCKALKSPFHNSGTYLVAHVSEHKELI